MIHTFLPRFNRFMNNVRRDRWDVTRWVDLIRHTLFVSNRILLRDGCARSEGGQLSDRAESNENIYHRFSIEGSGARYVIATSIKHSFRRDVYGAHSLIA